MMNNSFISGSSNINDDDPEIGSIEIPRKTIKDVEINLALSNSFGLVEQMPVSLENLVEILCLL